MLTRADGTGLAFVESGIETIGKPVVKSMLPICLSEVSERAWCLEDGGVVGEVDVYQAINQRSVVKTSSLKEEGYNIVLGVSLDWVDSTAADHQISRSN